MSDTPAIKNVTELIEAIRPVYRRAFELAALGMKLTWDLTWNIVPTPNGPQVMVICYAHVVALHQLGGVISHITFMPVNAPAEAITFHVTEHVKHLKSEQAKQLAAANGQGPAKPGIVLP